MAKILSQAEIDALLSTVAEDTSDTQQVGGGPPKRVVLYDFKHPNLISKEQMRMLENIHENFSRNFGVFLSAQLRMIVEIDLLAIDQLLYSEFVMSIAPPGVLYVIDTDNPEGQAILEFNPNLVIFVVEKLFGGKGAFASSTSRSISAIEEKIMRKVVERAIAELSNVWGPMIRVKMIVSSYESNPEFIQIVPSTEPVVVISMQIKIHDHKTLMNLCYPYRWLSDLVSRPDVQDKLQFGTGEASTEERQFVEGHLLKASCPVRAMLGNTTLTIQDFINLHEGDLLVLKERPDERNTVCIKEKPMFKGVIGRRDKYRAVLLTDYVEEGE